MNTLAPLMSSARSGDISKDEWKTPLWLFDVLDREFKFVLDPAATNENALCGWYFDKEEDGLSSEWFGSVFVNPPYSQLKKWVRKGFEEARNNKNVQRVVMLIPARTDTQAWWHYIQFGEVRFLPGRLRFEGGKFSAPFPSAIVIFHSGVRSSRAKTVYWNVRESTYANSV